MLPLPAYFIQTCFPDVLYPTHPWWHFGLWILALEKSLIGLNSSVVQTVTQLLSYREGSRATILYYQVQSIPYRAWLWSLFRRSDVHDYPLLQQVFTHSFMLNLQRQLSNDFLWVWRVSYKSQFSKTDTFSKNR